MRALPLIVCCLLAHGLAPVLAFAVMPTKPPVMDMVAKPLATLAVAQFANVNHVFFNRVSQSLEIHADQPLTGALAKETLPDGRVYWRLTMSNARWGLTLPSQAQLKAEINRALPDVDLVHYKTLDNQTIQLVLGLPANAAPTLRMNGPELSINLAASKPVVKPRQLTSRIPVLTPLPPAKAPAKNVLPVNALPGRASAATNPVLDSRYARPSGAVLVSGGPGQASVSASNQAVLSQVQQLQQQQAWLNVRLSQAEQALQAANQQLAKNQAGTQNTAQLQKDRDTLQAKLVSAEKDKTVLQARLTQLEQNSRQASQNTSQQAAQAANLSAEKQALQTQLAQAQKDRDALQNRLTQLEQSSRQASQQAAQAANLSAEKQALQTQLAQAQKDRDTVQARLTQLEQSRQQASQQAAQTANLAAEKQALQTQLAQAQKDRDTLQARLGSAEKTQAELQARFKNLTARPQQKSAQNTELAALKTQLEQINTERAAEKAELQTRIAQLEKSRTDLQQQLEDASKKPEHTNLSAQMAQLEQELALAKQNNARLQQELVNRPAQHAAPLKKPATGFASTATTKPVKTTAMANKNKAVTANTEATNTEASKTGDAPVKTATADKRWSQALSESDDAKANKLLAALIKSYPDDLAPVRQLADNQAGQGNWAQAVKTMQTYLSAHPNDEAAFEGVGMIYLKAERWSDAKLAFARVKNSQQLLDYGLKLKQAQKLPQAEAVLKLATELDPVDAARQFHLGNIYSAQQKLPEAKAAYLQALGLRTRFAEASYNLGIILSKLGDAEGAVARLENYLEWSPNASNLQAVQAYIDRLKAQPPQQQPAPAES